MAVAECLSGHKCATKYRIVKVGCVAQWQNAGLSPTNFPCPVLDLQLMGDNLCG